MRRWRFLRRGGEAWAHQKKGSENNAEFFHLVTLRRYVLIFYLKQLTENPTPSL
jgi:hypothetical protein